MKNPSEQFCHDILEMNINRSKSLANLVMALSSYQKADSIVELSNSPVFHYQFSSVFKAIHELVKTGETNEFRKAEILEQCLKYAKPQKRILLQTDVTPLLKEYSRTLENRQHVKKSNTVIRGNKPLGIGYPLSSINLSAESGWSLPLSRGRVPINQTESSYAVEQIKALLPSLLLSLKYDLVINTTDSSYTHAAYLSPLYQEDNLVCISRFRCGSKVFTSALATNVAEDNSQGTPKIYGDCFYLRNQTRIHKGKAPKTGKAYEKEQPTIYNLPFSEEQELETKTKKGRPIIIQLKRWNDLKVRTKNGHCMKHKPFDLVGVKVIDAATGELVFKREMFFGIFGKRKTEISLQQAYWDYRKRYDIEPSFRFNKQKMFLDTYDCEDVQHLDNFLLVNQLANWLLYVAADEVDFIPQKWERNKTNPPPKPDKLSIAKTHRSVERLFLTFDKKPFLPKTSKKGKGNIKKERPHFNVVIKAKKKPPNN